MQHVLWCSGHRVTASGSYSPANGDGSDFEICSRRAFICSSGLPCYARYSVYIVFGSSVRARHFNGSGFVAVLWHNFIQQSYVAHGGETTMVCLLMLVNFGHSPIGSSSSLPCWSFPVVIALSGNSRGRVGSAGWFHGLHSRGATQWWQAYSARECVLGPSAAAFHWRFGALLPPLGTSGSLATSQCHRGSYFLASSGVGDYCLAMFFILGTAMGRWVAILAADSVWVRVRLSSTFWGQGTRRLLQGFSSGSEFFRPHCSVMGKSLFCLSLFLRCAVPALSILSQLKAMASFLSAAFLFPHLAQHRWRGGYTALERSYGNSRGGQLTRASPGHSFVVCLHGAVATSN